MPVGSSGRQGFSNIKGKKWKKRFATFPIAQHPEVCTPRLRLSNLVCEFTASLVSDFTDFWILYNLRKAANKQTDTEGSG